jgi:hypothetical protein
MESSSENKPANEEEEVKPTVSDDQRSGWETPPQVWLIFDSFRNSPLLGANSRSGSAALYSATGQAYQKHQLLGVHRQLRPQAGTEAQARVAVCETRERGTTWQCCKFSFGFSI